jgi:hypothetical protein
MPQYFSIMIDETTEERAAAPPEHLRSGQKSRTKGREAIEPLESMGTSERTKRWQIEPKGSKTFRIQFDAQLIGNYKDVITFNLANGKTDHLFKLPVSGECRYPEINRSIKTLFAKRVLHLDARTQAAYVTDTSEFHFGSVLVQKERTGKSRPPQYRSLLNLVNISPVPVEFVVVPRDPALKCSWSTDANSGRLNQGRELH